jgi:protein arginine kinase activator
MLCQSCGEREATVHLTQMAEGGVKKMHLCPECAAQHGLNVEEPASLADVLFGMGAAPEPAPADAAKRCRECGMTPKDFRKMSRLGCPACYEAFADELGPMIAGMHKGTRHAGKVPAAEAEDMERTAEIAAMQEQLRRAVEAENYEEAAGLRDRIRQARKKARTAKMQRRRPRDAG